MDAGVYCGLLLEKDIALRMSKLLYRQQQEIKELLIANIEKTEVADWTLAYPDNKQVAVVYFNPNATVDDKIKRAELFTKIKTIQRVKDVFIAKNMDEAEYNYLYYYDKLEFLRDKKA